MPDVNSILDMEYFLYYDLIIKQVNLKKKETQQKEKMQRQQQNKKTR
jgi:hypothetical protein